LYRHFAVLLNDPSGVAGEIDGAASRGG